MSTIQKIDGPTVWRGVDFSGKGDVYIELDTHALDAIDQAVSATSGMALEALERRHFSTPVLDELMGAVAQEVLHGRGLVVLGGFPVEHYNEATIGRIFWALGRHLGEPVSQSVMGERLGHVVNHADTDPNSRGYRHHFELTPHTDFHDVVTFLCIQQGLKGGVSWFVSSHTLHNQMLAARPDLLEVLYRGYFTHRFGEQGQAEAPITEHRVPVFSTSGGRVSCRFLRRYIELAAHEGQPLSPMEREALETLDTLSMQPDNGFFLTLEPGEAVFINNFVNLHGRTAFEDGAQPQAKRHLMRLWLAADPPRPIAPEVAVYASERDGLGIAPQPGRTPSYDDSETVKRIYGDRMPRIG